MGGARGARLCAPGMLEPTLGMTFFMTPRVAQVSQPILRMYVSFVRLFIVIFFSLVPLVFDLYGMIPYLFRLIPLFFSDWGV